MNHGLRQAQDCACGPANISRSFAMKKVLRSQLVLAAAVTLAGAMCFAQDGAATYKAKCAMCHGPTGTPSAGMAKAMGIKPVSDPSIQALTVAQIEATVKNGKGKMKPIAGLTDPQVSAVAAYFKSLK
jgi:mono/diheme cytochrome c family protein